ncbi:ADP-ribosylation factor-binding protein GGA3 [Cricetulus griseus]|nr:ADP-ribosylation factor-binding protein GGA3 [Cricetulus griseus]
MTKATCRKQCLTETSSFRGQKAGFTFVVWLNGGDKATNPSNRQEDWEYIIGFCDQINKELEGPQIAVRLLAHKIQSPQEWEAVQALTVLEACMKNCGRRFHNEVGKFRFLNELIKVVSPKYLGDRVSEKVKTKVIELLFSWTLALPEEAKIKDAYQMLKRQGIVHSDPPIPMDRTLIPSPPPRPKNPVFDDEEKSKLLAKLLKSKNPDDLQEANKLIKSMVKEDEARIQKVTKRLHTLEEVNNNVKLLHEMLLHYNQEYSSEADKELMKELFDRCENKRRTLFKLASETEDNDNSLGDILQASDNLSRVINSYKTIVEGQTINGEVTTSTMPDSEAPLFLGGPAVSCKGWKWILLANLTALLTQPLLLLKSQLEIVSGICSRVNPRQIWTSSTPGQCLRPAAPQMDPCSLPQFLPQVRPKLRCLLPSQLLWSQLVYQPPALVPSCSLLDLLQPRFQRLSLQPQRRPDVLVVVVSMLNTAPLPVRSIVLQAAVPKSMKVKLQPPSGTELSPFSPIQPPAAITQVMLLANPMKEKVRLRYKLTFALGEQLSTELGEVDQFPPVEQWGNL